MKFKNFHSFFETNASIYSALKPYPHMHIFLNDPNQKIQDLLVN